jgi:predicted metal-binding membrane protein
MALLFVAGVMNLLWIACLAVFVLVERVLPGEAQTEIVLGQKDMSRPAPHLLGIPL